MAYEDFTTYTEFDEGADVTVDSATKVSWVSLLSRAETAYLYKDKGVNHFSGDFTHKFEVQFSNTASTCMVNHWVLANMVGDIKDIVNASGDALSFMQYSGTEALFLRIFENGAIAGDDSWAAPGPQVSTTYYIEVVRDDNGGANSTGRLTAYIRTGSHSGALQDTLVSDCSAGEQNDFRYLYALATYDDGGSGLSYSNGFTQNLDIGEAKALNANDVSSLSQITVPTIERGWLYPPDIPCNTQVTAPSISVKRVISIPDIESLSQVTVPAVTIVHKDLDAPDISCNTEVTVPSFSVKRQFSIPDIECLTQITAPTIFNGALNASDISCSTEITVPSFSVIRALTIPDIESSTEVSAATIDKQTPLNASDVSSLTEVTVAGIYKELFLPDIECSSEVEAADLEWVKVLKLNTTLPMITAEMSGGHGGFLNVELPMITAEMRAGAQLNVTLPMITAELGGSVGIKADLNVTLPMITAALEGNVEVLGELNVMLPMITARMTGTAGLAGQLNVTLPMITAALTGYTDIDGQLNVTLPMIEARLVGTVEREACEILRYEEPELE